jgi:hypothetical protein
MALADTTRNDVEAELREAIWTGRLVDLRPRDATADDPAQGAGWPAERTVPAALLTELLTTSQGSRRPRALRLAGARITGKLDLEAAELACPLLLRGCWFAEPPTLDEAQAPSVRLPGCHLPGLSADQLTTKGNLELNEGFSATGEVSLLGAHVGGQLDLSGATLTNPNGRTLTADGLIVDQSMVCREGFSATGEVRLLSAHVGGRLNLRGATLTNPNGLALSLQQLRAGALVLRDLTEPPELARLVDARIGALADEPASWPRQVILDGFVYDALYEYPPVRARQRLGWVARNPHGYVPQPYEQLAAVYRRAGRDQDARTVAIAKQWRRRRTLHPLGKAWNLLLWATVGYGYRMWLAIAWLLLLVGVGWWRFDQAHPAHLVAAKPPGQRPPFHSGIYALDLLLPFADLGYQGAWIATGPARWLFLGWNLAGWVLTTAVVAALTGLLRRD